MCRLKIDKGSKVAASLATRASCSEQSGGDVLVALWRNGKCESKEPSRKRSMERFRECTACAAHVLATGQ